MKITGKIEIKETSEEKFEGGKLMVTTLVVADEKKENNKISLTTFGIGDSKELLDLNEGDEVELSVEKSKKE